MKNEGETMLTKVLVIDRQNFKQKDLSEAGELLREGKLVAFPTETVYGLGGNALDKTASKRIYEAKGRPSDNPLIVHIAETDDIKNIAVDIPDAAFQLAEKFWPGPLTIILKKNECVPDETTGGLKTVAIRMPSDEIARALIKESDVYIAAPSANASGRPSTTTAEHVIEDLDGRIDMVIDGGPVQIGLESTIIDLTGEVPMILRPGYITKEQLAAVVPEVVYDKAVVSRVKLDNVVARAPGMKYRHYAPKGELTIFEGAQKEVTKEIIRRIQEHADKHTVVGILATDETQEIYRQAVDGEMSEFVHIISLGKRADEEVVASHLFKCLREFDDVKAEFIYAESFSEMKIGQAVMNRLLKAAGYHILTV